MSTFNWIIRVCLSDRLPQLFCSESSTYFILLFKMIDSGKSEEKTQTTYIA